MSTDEAGNQDMRDRCTPAKIGEAGVPPKCRNPRARLPPLLNGVDHGSMVISHFGEAEAMKPDFGADGNADAASLTPRAGGY